MIGCEDDVTSLCSVAPSLSELDDELAQYADLLMPTLTAEDIKSDVQLKVEKLSTDPVSLSQSAIFAALRPTAASLGLEDVISDCLHSVEESEDQLVLKEDGTAGDGELDLTDINDDEIDKLILSEEEVKIKTAMWMRQNADFLKEMKEKEERKAREREEQPEPKKRKLQKRKPKVEPRTAGEAFEKMVQEKKLSRKINYDVLNHLNPSGFKPESVIGSGTVPTTEQLTGSRLNENTLKQENAKITAMTNGTTVNLSVDEAEVDEADVDEDVESDFDDNYPEDVTHLVDDYFGYVAEDDLYVDY
jgi:hypothetical protein